MLQGSATPTVPFKIKNHFQNTKIHIFLYFFFKFKFSSQNSPPPPPPKSTYLSGTQFSIFKEICQLAITSSLFLLGTKVFLFHSLPQMIVEEVENTITVYQVLVKGQVEWWPGCTLYLVWYNNLIYYKRTSKLTIKWKTNFADITILYKNVKWICL